MYSRKATKQQIEEASKRLGIELEPTPVNIARSYARDIQALVEHRKGGLKRDLTPDETRWIRNERALCRCDFLYFLERYAKIIDQEGNLVYCVPNVGQRVLLDIWGEHEDQGTAIAEINLKARQIGVSTLAELAGAHRVMFYPYVNAIVASADPEKSARMARIITRAWEHCPWFLMPQITEFRLGEFMRFGKLDSSVSVEWLNQQSGIARGTTPTFAHVSEVAECDSPKDLIEASLIRAMHPSPRMFLLLESTANGYGNWWHDRWQTAVRDWPDGLSDLRPVFLPWYVATDKYPTATWLLAHPIPSGWAPAALTKRHAGRARDYVRKNTLLSKHFGSRWEMPLEQAWYWEYQRRQALENKQLNRFLQEMCADDKEAFQHKQDSIFDAEVISLYRENVEQPVGVFGLVGHDRDVPLRLQPDERSIDHDRPRVPIRTDSGLTFELVPLQWTGYTMDNPDGRIYVWQWPQARFQYGIGVDTGYGIGQDRSAIEVMRKAEIDSHARQVAELASANISASDLTPFCYALGSLFSTVHEGDQRQPRMVIEINANGETTQLALRKMGWRNFHRWIRYDKTVIDQSKATRLGAFTVNWSRSMIMEYMVKALRDFAIEIDSPWLITELAQLGKDPAKQRIEAMSGGYDDRIMALGWVFLSLHILDPNPVLPMFGRARIPPPDESGAPPKYEEYSAGFQERDFPVNRDVFGNIMSLAGQRRDYGPY